MSAPGGDSNREAASAAIGDSNVALRCIGLERRFGGLRALKAVSFDVRCGEIFGLVGPNGSGKTTTVNVATGFYPPNEGSVLLFWATEPLSR